jgi:hypothetical protein
MWATTEVLLMKAWMETRWRLLGACAYPALFLFLDRQNPTVHGMVTGMGTVLTICAMMFAGTGVRSQAPALFREGVAGSTQFTISLPVSRRRLLTIRAAAGLMEAAILKLITALATWALVPVIRSAVAPADFARLVLIVLLFMSVPYSAVVFFNTLVDDPISGIYAGYSTTLVLWLLHQAGPAVDIIRVGGQNSPLVTHGLPWPQMATMVCLTLILFWAAIRSVETREY